MAANIYDWSLVAANNASADADLTWAEGMAPSAVNNSARVMMQRARQLLTDIGGATAAGGTANAITLTASSPFAAYADGQIVGFKATANNSGAATLNVNGIGAKSVRIMAPTGDIALNGGEIISGGMFFARYLSALNAAAGGWLLENPVLSKILLPAGGIIDFGGADVRIINSSIHRLSFQGASFGYSFDSSILGGGTILTSAGGIGYTTGAGGTVTQATSKGTAYTLNAICGQITFNNSAIPANSIQNTLFNNSAMAATDVMIVNHVSGGTVGAYTFNPRCGAGVGAIDIRNNTSGSLSEAIVLQFAIIKASNS